MRPEKKYLVEEVNQHLGKSEHLFLADFTRMSVIETADLRKRLAPESAEFHVVKNSILSVAAKERGLPALDEALDGPTAIVVGGANPSEVAKILFKFLKDKDKLEVKLGVMGDRTLTRAEVEELSKLPSLPELRAQLLCLFNTPATQMARIVQAVPQGFLNVLQARAEKESA